MTQDSYDFGTAHIRAYEFEGALVVSDLQGEGNPGDLLAAFRAIQEVAKVRPVFLTVSHDNPRKEQLMRVYKRLGAKENAMLFTVGDW